MRISCQYEQLLSIMRLFFFADAMFENSEIRNWKLKTKWTNGKNFQIEFDNVVRNAAHFTPYIAVLTYMTIKRKK